MSHVSTKVILSKEVAEAIKDARRKFSDSEIVSAANGWNTYGEGSMEFLRKWGQGDRTTGREDLLMRALVIGYQVEQTPEEKLRNIYLEYEGNYQTTECWGWDNAYAEGVLYGIEETLGLLGITIEGINGDKS